MEPDIKTNWKGFTLKELRFQRALNQVKMQIEKERLFNSTNRFVNNGGQGSWGFNLVKKLVNGLSYVDMILLGFEGVRQVRKVVGFFGKKKR